MLARIVHVADAFDAMTSARAYRPALDSGYAIRELWRCAGTQFDAEVVQALVQAVAVAGPGTLATQPASRCRHAAPSATAGTRSRPELNVRLDPRFFARLAAVVLMVGAFDCPGVGTGTPARPHGHRSGRRDQHLLRRCRRSVRLSRSGEHDSRERETRRDRPARTRGDCRGATGTRSSTRRRSGISRPNASASMRESFPPRSDWARSSCGRTSIRWSDLLSTTSDRCRHSNGHRTVFSCSRADIRSERFSVCREHGGTPAPASRTEHPRGIGKFLRTTIRRRPRNSSPGQGSRLCPGSASAPASRTAPIAARTTRTTTVCPTTGAHRCRCHRLQPRGRVRVRLYAAERRMGAGFFRERRLTGRVARLLRAGRADAHTANIHRGPLYPGLGARPREHDPRAIDAQSARAVGRLPDHAPNHHQGRL